MYRPRTACHTEEGFGSGVLTSDPDLLLLRSAVMRQVEATLTYREDSRVITDRRLAGLFRTEAQHEAGHIVELNRMIARLDPDQATEFRDHDLAFLANETSRGGPTERGHGDGGGSRKGGDREAWLKELKDAVQLELNTLNIYQEDALRASHPEVRALLTNIMNHEKEDYAIFLAEMVRLIHGM
jgi:rubrerythrin